MLNFKDQLGRNTLTTHHKEETNVFCDCLLAYGLVLKRNEKEQSVLNVVKSFSHLFFRRWSSEIFQQSEVGLK